MLLWLNMTAAATSAVATSPYPVSTPWSRVYDNSEAGSGMGRMKKNPRIMGNAVPKERSKRNADVSPANAKWAIVENRNADRPNPDNTIPVVVAL